MSVTLLKTNLLNKKTLEAKIEELRFLDREIKKLTKEYEPLKKEIIKEMVDQNLLSAVDSHGHEIATYNPRKSPCGWDKVNFDLKYPGLYNEFKIEKPDTYAFNLK